MANHTKYQGGREKGWKEGREIGKEEGKKGMRERGKKGKKEKKKLSIAILTNVTNHPKDRILTCK